MWSMSDAMSKQRCIGAAISDVDLPSMTPMAATLPTRTAGRSAANGLILANFVSIVSAEAVTVRRIPDPGEPVPVLAWPTVLLFAGALGAWVGSTAAALAGVWPWPVSA